MHVIKCYFYHLEKSDFRWRYLSIRDSRKSRFIVCEITRNPAISLDVRRLRSQSCLFGDKCKTVYKQNGMRYIVQWRSNKMFYHAHHVLQKLLINHAISICRCNSSSKFKKIERYNFSKIIAASLYNLRNTCTEKIDWLIHQITTC